VHNYFSRGSRNCFLVNGVSLIFAKPEFNDL
jgi:hypothetical protein